MRRESVGMSEGERMTGLAIAQVMREVVQTGLLLLGMRRPKDMKPGLIHTGQRGLALRMLLPMQSVGQVADPGNSAAAC